MAKYRGAVLAAGAMLAAAFSSGAVASWSQGNANPYGTPVACTVDQVNNWTDSPEVYTSEGQARSALLAKAMDAYSSYPYGYCLFDYTDSGSTLRCRSRYSSTNNCNPSIGCPNTGSTFSATVSCVATSTQPGNCPSGGYAGSMSGNKLGTGYCLGSCAVDPQAYFPEQDRTLFSHTGADCTGGEPTLSPIVPTQDGNPNPALTENSVCKTVDGVVQCTSTENPQCGYVNGERYCADPSDLDGTDECRQTASGSVFCILSSPTSSAAPDDGTGTNAAEPDTTVTRDDGTTTQTIYWYNGTTAANSTNYGDGPGGDTGGGSGMGSSCGGEGQPACDVKLEEEEMPSPPGLTEWDGSTSGVAGAAGDSPASGWSLATWLPSFENGTCQSLELTFFGWVKSFPGTEGCVYLEDFKDGFGFALYIGTLLFIGFRVARSV